MPFTVQLDLDAEAKATLGVLAETLAGIPGLATVRQLGDVHHISLAIHDDPPLDRFVPALAAFAETLTPFEVRLANIGLLADLTNVVFLGVVFLGVVSLGVVFLGVVFLGVVFLGVVFLGVVFLGVVFRGVVVTDSLLALHRRAHAALGAFRESCWEYYLRGAWVPHVSLALDATNAAAQAATATLLAH